jgi:hypothetical protein
VWDGTRDIVNGHCFPLVQVVQLLEDFSMVQFTTLDINDEESIEELLQSIDLAIQVCVPLPCPA